MQIRFKRVSDDEKQTTTAQLLSKEPAGADSRYNITTPKKSCITTRKVVKLQQLTTLQHVVIQLLDLHVRKFIHFRLTQEKLKKNSMKQAPAEEIERDLDVNGKLMAIQNDFARFVVNVGIELQNCGEAQQKRGA